MPRNNRVKKAVKPYNLRLAPNDYDKIQEIADSDGISMNTKLQFIISDYISGINKEPSDNATELLTNEESKILETIKSLPLKERQAIISKLIDNLSDGNQ